MTVHSLSKLSIHVMIRNTRVLTWEGLMNEKMQASLLVLQSDKQSKGRHSEIRRSEHPRGDFVTVNRKVSLTVGQSENTAWQHELRVAVCVPSNLWVWPWFVAWSFLMTSSLKSKWTLPLAQGERRYISPTHMNSCTRYLTHTITYVTTSTTCC